MICESCFYFNEINLLRRLENGKVYPCLKVNTPGGRYWDEHQKAPKECADIKFKETATITKEVRR